MAGTRGERDHEGQGSWRPQQGGFQARPPSNLSSESLHPGNAPRQKFPMTLRSPSPLGHSPRPRHVLRWKICDLLRCARPGSPSTAALSVAANDSSSPSWTLRCSSRGRRNEIDDCRWLCHRWSQEETSGPSRWHLAWSSASSRAWAHQWRNTLPTASS